MSRVSVLGLGYIGLPTAAILAVRGHQVAGMDVREDVVDTLRDGRVHIVEPELDVAVHAAISSGALRVGTEVEPAEVFMIAVPTPFTGNKKPDLTYVRATAEAVAPRLVPGNLVIVESTIPVGTTEQYSRWLAERRPDLRFPHEHGEDADIRVAHCPERVLPGQVLKELIENDRVVGGLSDACTRAAIDLYKTFVQGQCLGTTAATAEMAKLTENAFRDVNIAFANELSIIAEEHGVDVWELIELANHHPRVNILQPGPGVGGHCIAVDPWFLVDTSPETARLIRTAREVNDTKPRFVLEKVRAALAGIDNPVVACLGLSFKPDIDDLRESPAVDICAALVADPGLSIKAAEPHIESLPESLARFSNVELLPAEQAVAGADVVLLLVNHEAFRDLPERVDLGHRPVIDTRGQWRKYTAPEPE